MSYSVSTTLKSPADAKAALQADPEYEHVPEHIKAELEASLDQFAENGVKVVDVTCFGHKANEHDKRVGCSSDAHITVTIIEGAE